MDELGRYTLSEMRTLVRRSVDGLRPSSIDASGAETGVAILDPLVTNQDIDYYLNTALTERAIQINIADERSMADEDIIDVEANRADYPLPADIFALRALYWKPPTTSLSSLPRSERLIMHVDDDSDPIGYDYRAVPTYRRNVDGIVLNGIPNTNNPGGILVDYVKYFNPLTTDDQVLETSLARPLQETIICDAAVYLTSERLKIDASDLMAKQARLSSTLLAAATAAYMPKSVQLVPSRALIRERA